MRRLKRLLLDLLARANYAVLHADQLARERHDADVAAQKLARLQNGSAKESAIGEPLAEPASQSPVASIASAQRDGESAPAASKIDIRPLVRVTDDADYDGTSLVDKQWMRGLLASKRFKAIEAEFRGYPRLSFVTDIERAFLYCLVRSMKPAAVAEVGTAFCGTSEIIARALWENGNGVLHTTDPFGETRCPAIFRQWPEPLQNATRFYTKSSMDFFLALDAGGIKLDIAFVDGNHDFEFAYFDILMAARLLRPGGALIVDNAEQSGPFFAVVQFLRHHPDWIELGDAVGDFKRSNPFAMDRSTVPHGGFLALRSPAEYCLGNVPRSAGQVASPARVNGFSCRIVSKDYRGTLHYRLILRAFRDENREIGEYRTVGRIPLDAAIGEREVNHRLDQPLVSLLQERHGDCTHTLETELAWEGPDEEGTIGLVASPVPLVG